MIPEKIKSVINSCETHETLDTCIKWIDYIFPFIEQRSEAYDLVRLRKDELELKTN
jgi:hypothetical protein